MEFFTKTSVDFVRQHYRKLVVLKLLARGPHLSFRNPSRATKINNLIYKGKLCCIFTLLND